MPEAAVDPTKPVATPPPAPPANPPVAPSTPAVAPAATPAVDPKPATPAPATPTPDAGADVGDDEGYGLLGDDEDAGKPEPAKPADADAKPVAWSDRREAVAKAAEEKWTAKAKTDDDKKAVGDRVDRLKKQLARYGTEEAAILAGLEAQEKLRAGQKTAKPAEGATKEEVAAYRESVGLPKEPQDYSIPRVEVTTADGRKEAIQWTEDHKPLHDSFRAVAFANDMSQAQVDALVKWQFASVEEAKQQQEDRIRAIDKADKKEARETLREEFGEEFQPRLAVVDRLLKDDERLPGGAGKMLWEARTPDGRKLVHHPAIIKLLSDLAVSGGTSWEPYGDGAIMTGDAKASLADDEDKIRTIMKNDFQKYINEGWDKKLTAILQRKEKMGRAA